ncbi:FUSC family protein [Anaerococcus sp. Marseille-Q7828]|uniref:FUSC family protein n=1 Tax=Anaerococcus sp. Marseille-Q7828 TaxID=3036300 RepID=UPI0024ACE8CA|nr:FUSC family protein [Anaerococcus sp. Marseille-Q7828]
MKFKKPGLRIVKTFIAVTLAMLISSFRPGEGLPFYSAIAAIICLKSDVEGSREIGINRVIGTMLGGLCGLLYLLIVPANYLPRALELILISLLASIIIWVMAMAGKPKAISIMAIVFLSITINHGNEGNLPFLFAFNRTFDTMVGVIMAIVVNWSDFEIRENYNKNH